jgi:uncharacterized protein (DUF362 family)
MSHDDQPPPDEELSRRELLKRTAALAALAVTGAACSSGDDDSASAAGSPGQPAAGQPGAGSEAPPVGASGSAAGSSSNSGKAGGGAQSGSGGMSSGGTSAQSGSGGSEPMASADAGNMTGGDAGSGDNGKIKVVAVKRADLDEAVALAVQLAGGIDEIQEGQTVFIKPNAVSDRAIGTPGIRTSNEVLSAVIRLVKARKPGRIIVGDRSAREFNTMQVFQNAGIATAAMAAGADEVYMAPSPADEPDAWVKMMPPGYDMTWSSAGGILAMRKIVEADHLVNVPTCKNHRYALHTLSMKNFIGAIGDSSRDVLHYGDTLAGNFETLCRDIAVLNQMFSPLINIIDATSAVINGGPQGDGSDTVRTSPGLILASKNRVALDALAISLIKLELGRNDVPQPDASHEMLMNTKPFMLPQLANGAMLGIGPADGTGVELIFDAVPDAADLETIYRS